LPDEHSLPASATSQVIKAEIVSYEDLVAVGSVAAARAAGKARIEGKDHVMQDGDVVEFRQSATSRSS
jgi:ribosome-binding ATPase YchF (GTP1/OBG family)